MPRKKPNPNKPVIAKKGLVICYVGQGKGKTTAAMGTAVRAAGAGLNAYILQFVKSAQPDEGEKRESGEWPLSNEINFFDNVSYNGGVGKIDTEQVGAGFVGILGDKKEKAAHIRQALKGLELARQALLSGDYELVVLDEILSAVDLKLLEQRDILDLLSIKPELTHILMTGHSKYPKIFKQCDIVTEMKMIKHGYYEGVLAQRGIDY